jgi:hypothetical protein
MKIFLAFTAAACISFVSSHAFAQASTLQATVIEDAKLPKPAPAATHLYIDVHHLGAGNVNAKALAAAHLKDLAVQKKIWRAIYQLLV